MLSVVVPVFNEEESLIILYKRLKDVLSNIKRGYEIIFLDDGSKDNSLNILKKLVTKDKLIRVFSFRKNHGKSEVLTFGFQEAKGDFIITLDADLQDKPEEIKKLLDQTKGGIDLVCGWRKNRSDPLPKIISSKFFNFLARFFWGLNLHDYNCGLKVYSRDAAKSLKLYGGMHRFIPLLVYQKGFKVSEVDILHDNRKFGKSKYGFSKLWKDLPDIFTMLFLNKYSQRPLHFFGMVGGFFLFVGVIILGYLSYIHFQGEAIGRRPLLFLGMLLVLSGFQVFLTGFLADLVINISHRNSDESALKYSSK